MSVGKEVSFTSLHSLPSNDENFRDLGNAEIAGVDLATEVLKNGWAKLKEIKREPSEEDSRRKELESEAKAAGKGMWNPHGPKVGTSTKCCQEVDRTPARPVLSTTRCPQIPRHLYRNGKGNLWMVRD